MRDAALPFVLLLVFGLLLMRRGARQRRSIASMQSSVVVGARVLTTSGLYATVVALDDTTATLETGPGQRSTWDRRAVARVLDRPSDGPDGDAQDAPGYPGGTTAVTGTADSSPAVASPPLIASGSEPSPSPSPTPDHAAAPDLSGPDLITEPPAAPPAGSVPGRQPPSDETTPRGPA